jgi:hypothetical protein
MSVILPALNEGKIECSVARSSPGAADRRDEYGVNLDSRLTSA